MPIKGSFRKKPISAELLLAALTSACMLNIWIAAFSAKATQRPSSKLLAQTSTTTSQPNSSSNTPNGNIPQNQNQKVSEKDTWDKLNAVSGLISGGLVTAVGIAATYLYNERQRKNSEAQKSRELQVLQVQTLQGFMPQLQSPDPKAVEAALLAITALGNETLATELAAIYRNEGAISALSKIASAPNRTDSGAVSALSKIASGSNREAAKQAEKSLESLFEALAESVVVVSTEKEKKSGGCGFFIREDGLLVTPNFVVKNAENITVSFRGRDYIASTISQKATNTPVSLVVLKIDGTGFPVLPIPKKATVDAGEEVFILGRNWSQENWTFSSGTVTGYTIEASGERYIKVNAKIAPGYAGAPAINRKSEVVGVVVSKDQEHAYLLDVGVVFQITHQNN
ncbi:MAG: serine protease [Cyanobacteria bacterium J06650_10]